MSYYSLQECLQLYPVKVIATTLDVVASFVHLKHKYHNLQGEPVTINADLEGVRRIYQSLYKYQGEGMAMDINVASLIG